MSALFVLWVFLLGACVGASLTLAYLRGREHLAAQPPERSHDPEEGMVL